MDKTRLKKLIKETLQDTTKKKCSCGCNKCKTTGKSGVMLNESIAPKQILSENLQYHVTNQIPLTENTFRYGSEAFLNLWAEARALYLREIIHVNEDDKQILEETDLGNFGLYEGVKVPLDLLLLENEELEESDKKKNPPLGKPKRGGSKKFYVYVKNPKTKKIKKISFGDTTGLSAKINNLLKIRANEIPLTDIMTRVIEKGEKNSPLYKDLELEFKKDSIDMDEIKNILKDYGVYFEYDDLLNINESKNSPAYKGPEGYDDGSDSYINETDKKTPPIGKPKRGGSKKFYVYVRDKGKVKKVSFGQAGMSAKINDPKARRAFAARHDCKNKKDRTKPSYWSCRLPRYAKLLGLKSSFSGFW